jgi:predicted DNA-binding transcriptional regulator YafY
VNTLTEFLLLEDKINPVVWQKQVATKQRISIQYKGDKENPKGWYTLEPVGLSTDAGVKYGDAYRVLDKKTGALADFKSKFNLDLISNWNVLSTKPTTAKTNQPGEDPIADAVVNKRVVSMYYKGDKENEPGFRTGIEPVCYGTMNGDKYLRAWQKGGTSVSAEAGDQKRQLPSWRFFKVSRIRQWKVTGNEVFTVPPAANFNPKGDKMMDTVIAIADFGTNDDDGTPPPTTPTAPTKSTEPKPSTTSTGGTEPEQTPEEPKKKVKGPARPGATKPERNKKGPARPGAIDESAMIDSIMDAIDIF